MKMGLILSRLPGESITIGEGEDAIELIVSRIRGNRVTLSITAPKNRRIMRGEVRDKLTKQVVAPCCGEGRTDRLVGDASAASGTE